DSMRSSGENDGSGKKSCASAQKFNQRRHVENHVVGVPILHDFAVEDGPDLKRVGIWDFVRGDDAWSERSERVEKFAAAPLSPTLFDLPIAGADIVGASVSENVI